MKQEPNYPDILECLPFEMPKASTVQPSDMVVSQNRGTPIYPKYCNPKRVPLILGTTDRACPGKHGECSDPILLGS